MSINLALIGPNGKSLMSMVQTPTDVSLEFLRHYEVGQVERAMEVYRTYMRSQSYGTVEEEVDRHISKLYAYLGFVPGSKIIIT